MTQTAINTVALIQWTCRVGLKMDLAAVYKKRNHLTRPGIMKKMIEERVSELYEHSCCDEDSCNYESYIVDLNEIVFGSDEGDPSHGRYDMELIVNWVKVIVMEFTDEELQKRFYD